MKRSNQTHAACATTTQKRKTICDCTDYLWANLVQYDAPGDPLLAECTKKPQTFSARFPYEVEVAKAKKLCPMYKHTDAVKTPEIRAKHRHFPMACHVKSQPQQTL